MKVGVIGVGYWGKKHVEEYSNISSEVTVSDLVEENLKICKEKFGVKTTRDYKDILNDPEIKAVSICTPNHTHFKIAKDCLLANKNVLVEKPMVLSSKEAGELIKIGRGNKLVLTVGHLFRFNNALRKVKEMLRGNELGRIYSVSLKWNNLEPIFSDRDILFDLAVHPLDIILYLFERSPDRVFCNGSGFRQKNNEISIINYHIGEIFVNIEVSWIKPIKERILTIVGSEKTLLVDCISQRVDVITNSDRSVKTLDIYPSNTLREELESFLKSIQEENVNGTVSAEIGREVIRLIELSMDSLRKKKEIELR